MKSFDGIRNSKILRRYFLINFFRDSPDSITREGEGEDNKKNKKTESLRSMPLEEPSRSMLGDVFSRTLLTGLDGMYVVFKLATSPSLMEKQFFWFRLNILNCPYVHKYTYELLNSCLLVI